LGIYGQENKVTGPNSPRRDPSRGFNQLARDLDVPPNRISMIVNGERSITADTALRLGTCFGMSPETWLNLQTEYDIRRAKRQYGEEIERRVRRHDAA
jgi:addiction module HigA family antidote